MYECEKNKSYLQPIMKQSLLIKYLKVQTTYFILVCLFQLLASYQAKGQAIKFFPLSLSEYPRTQELSSGIIENTSNLNNIKLTFRVKNETTVLIDTTILLDNIVVGINKYDLPIIWPIKENNLYTDSGYLFPGRYNLTITFTDTNEAVTLGEFSNKNIIVSPYTILWSNINDTLTILRRIPQIEDGDTYIKIRQKLKLRNINSREHSYMIKDTINWKSYFENGKDDILSYENFWFIKEQIVSNVNNMVNKSNFQSSKLKIRNPNSIIKAGGSVTYEQLYSNYTSPNQISSNRYHRLFLTPKIEIAGIPFTTSIQVNSNNSFSYPNNYFNLEFDKTSFRNKIEQITLVEKERLIQDISNKKLKLAESNDRKKRLNNKLATLDSISAKNVSDTILLKQLSLRREQISKEFFLIDHEINDLQKGHLVDSIKYNNLLNPNSSQISTNKPNKVWLSKCLLNVQDFSLGNQAPYLSDFLFSYRPINGIYLHYQLKKITIKALTGRSIFSQNLGLSPAGIFNTIAVGFGNSYNNPKWEIGISYNLPNSGKANSIISVGNRQTIGRKALLSSEIAITNTDTSLQNPSQKEKLNNSLLYLAWKVEATIILSSNSQLKLSTKYIGNSFQSLGVVNLNNDWCIYNIKYNKRFIRGLFDYEALAEGANSNISGNKYYSSAIKSISSSLRSNFRVMPNFTGNFKLLDNKINSIITSESGMTNKSYLNRFFIWSIGCFDDFKVKETKIRVNLNYVNTNSYSPNGAIASVQNISFQTSITPTVTNTFCYRLNHSLSNIPNYYGLQQELQWIKTMGGGNLKLSNNLIFSKATNNIGRVGYNFTISARKSFIDFSLKAGIYDTNGSWYNTANQFAYFLGTTISMLL